MRRAARHVAVALGLAVALWAPVVPGAGRALAGGPPQFATELVQGIGSGEPSVAYDPKGGWTYADAPEGTTVVWRKHGSGSWQPGVGTLGSGGDSDIAYDADGVVYASDLTDPAGSNPVSVSLDHGHSFAYKSVTMPHGGSGLVDTSGGIWDRQWLAAWGHGNVVATAGYFPSLLSSTEVEHAWISKNRGRTFEGPFTITPPVGGAGKIVHASDGRLYMPYDAPDSIGIAVSTDGGRNWSQHTVAAGAKTDSFPGVAVDDGGAVYVTWIQVGFNTGTPATGLNVAGVVKVARSTDHGSTWTTPVVVSDPGRTAVMPWIVAGGKGRVAVLYYAARNPGVDAGPDLGTPATKWDIEIGQTLNGRNAQPAWVRQVAVPAVHTGSICTEGIGCASPEAVGLINLPLPFDRRLLDFFGAAIKPDGSIVFVYPTDRPASSPSDLVFANVDIRSATQISGSRLR